MLVTLSGMVMPVRLVQPLKANSPMLVTLFGMVTLVRKLGRRGLSEKAPPPMLVTLLKLH
jgi:hypothetical protein